MFLQRAAAALLKRVRLTPKPFCASRGPATNDFPTSLPSKLKFYNENGSRGYTWRVDHMDLRLLILISGQAIILGLNSNPVLAEGMPIDSNPENDMEGASITGLRKVEDGSVVSNIHTSKWRVFTDNGRDFFLQGKLKEAEKFFHSALQEAKEGFGERDPHVASACNNLAELYRVKKAFDKAEPLYLEAINILEESFGPEDIRLGAAYHNLGQFYLVQRKLEEARVCYECALKIKQRVLGHAHTDYADTMYHLGTVLYLQGKERDAEALIQDSIRILEDADQGESITCIRRLRYLSQIYLKSNRPAEAENIQRKILHIMELSKGWESLDTVNAAEALALTLQSTGNLKEAQEFLERCLDARKTLLPEDHVQVAGNMLHLARVSMLSSNMLRKMHIAEALKELDKAKDLLLNSARIAQNVLNKLIKHRGCNQNAGAFGETQRNGHAAFVILLQSLDALALLETTRRELLDSKEGDSAMHGAENALFRCISAYREFGSERLLVDSPEVKSEYLSCLKHFATLIADITAEGKQPFSGTTLPGLKDEIKRIEAEISSYRRSKHRASS